MKSELFTIAISLYNNEQTIKKCVETVLNQSYRNIEILIIDDGSTDNSLKILNESFTDERINIIQKDNGGLSSSRQLALDKASGQYISFIDADDYICESYVGDFYGLFQKYNVDVCICGTLFVDSAGYEIPGLSRSFDVVDRNLVVLDKKRLVNHYQLIVDMFNLSDSWNKAYNINFLRKSGIKFCLPKGLNGTDLAFNYKLFLHLPSVSTISKRNYVHVIYDSSAVHRKNKNLLNGFNQIFLQVIKETHKIGIFNLISPQLSSLYIGLVRADLQDIFGEIGDLKERFRQVTGHMIIAHKYIEKMKLRVAYLSDDTKSLRLFKKLFLKKSNLCIFCYLFIRKTTMTMIGKKH